MTSSQRPREDGDLRLTIDAIGSRSEPAALAGPPLEDNKTIFGLYSKWLERVGWPSVTRVITKAETTAPVIRLLL